MSRKRSLQNFKKMNNKSLILIPILFQISFAYCQTTTKEFPVLKGPYLGQTPPGNMSQIFAPGFVSTQFGELNSVFTADGKEFYFSRRGIPGQPSAIMVTKRINNVWTKPLPVNFSGIYNDVDLFLTPDGKSMIYCSGRIVDKGNKVMMNNDFWISRRIGDLWGEPTKFAEEAVSEFEDYFPAVAQSGNLYFNSQRGGQGTNDIYCSKYVNGKYSSAEKLPAPINSEFREFDAFVSQDEKIIIFSSERPGGFGGSDIYISFKKSDNSWSEPLNLGNDINTAASEYGATISPDGKYFFYTSNRNGNEDIFWVSAGFIKEYIIK
jgi:WD40-like Beta Propeller Repeat